MEKKEEKEKEDEDEEEGEEEEGEGGKEEVVEEAAAVFLRLDADGSGALEWREVYAALVEP